MICTFFGHANTPQDITPALCAAIIDLIEHHDVSLFYVGNHGNFDNMVKKQLKHLKALYPHIDYAVVLSRLPGKQREYEDLSDTIFPEGLEDAPPRYAISHRNRWMLKQADFVVTYVAHEWGGAAQFADAAKRQKRTVINLYCAK